MNTTISLFFASPLGVANLLQ